MAFVERIILTKEKDGMNVTGDFYDDCYIVQTHEEAQEAINEIANKFYPALLEQYIREQERKAVKKE